MEDNILIKNILDDLQDHFKLKNITDIRNTLDKDKDHVAKYFDNLIIKYIICKKYPASIYYFGLRQKMFNIDYNFYKELKWIINSIKSDNSAIPINNQNSVILSLKEKETIIEKIHEIYYKVLNRGADLSVISSILDNKIFSSNIEYELSHSIEKYCIDWINEYYLYYSLTLSVNNHLHLHIKNNSQYQIENEYFYNYLTMMYKPNHFENIKIIMEEYSQKLNYLPSQKDLEYFWIYKNSIDFHSIVDQVIINKDDYKYLEECRLHFSRISKNSIHQKDNIDQLKIKFYGPVGTSGYAKICRDIINSLTREGNDILIQFIPIQFQNYSMDESGNDNELLSLYSKNIISNPDYIILHSVPDLWPAICIKEREIMNKNDCIIPIYGITVWETETLPKDWDIYCQFVDKISVPSRFSSIAFKNNVLLQKIKQPIDIVHHPVLLYNHEKITNECILKKENLGQLYSFIFYNISEWTNRKGISELIEAFCSRFIDDKTVLLYIKTFGDISKDEAKEFMKKYNNPSNIIIDYERVDDTYIQCIHNCGDCFVSLTKSEGQGIGLCHAALNKKSIIVTGYSGHLDYLKHINLIKYTMEPATFCTIWSKKHEDCKYLPYCQFFNLFIPSTHSWAKPCIIDAGNKMVDVYKKRLVYNNKTYNYIVEFNSNKFKNDLLNSLKSTIPRKSTNNLFLQQNKINNKLAQLSQLSQIYYFDWKIQKKKKIIVIGASKNGNLGDDMYPFVIKEFFKDDNYNIINISDNEVEIIDDSIVSLKTYNGDNLKLSPFDYLIIGGGGLLNIERIQYNNGVCDWGNNGCIKWNNSIHLYSEYAQRIKIPYYIVSVGFQDLSITDSDQSIKNKFSSFSLLLNGADYISMRSPMDYHVANLIVDPYIKDYIFQYPDLGYSLKKYTLPYIIKQKRNILLVTVDTWIDINKKYIQYDILKKINEYKMKNIEYRLIFTVFTGVNKKNNIFVSDQEKIIKKKFPGCEIIPGLQPDIKNYHYPSRTSTIYTMTQLLINTHTIITGRYHGYVLAKTFGVPHIETYGYCNYKIESEKKNYCSSKEKSSLVPLETIREYIQKGIYFKRNNRGNGGNSDDNRNNNIVNIHKKTGIDISIIQNWTDKKIIESFYDL